MKLKLDRSIQAIQGLAKPWSNQRWGLSALWLLLLCGLAFLWRLGSVGLVDETEPLFAEAARQMLETGDWITPYFNGETRFDKPPLVYWLMAIAYQVIGVNEWAVRLPSALAAIALVGMGFWTLRSFGFPSPGQVPPDADQPIESAIDRQRWQSAWIGAAIMALNFQTIVWARTGVSDMLLSGCMGTALLAFFWGYAEPSASRTKTGWYLAFFVLSALAVLTKGPVGIVVPLLIVGAFLLYVGKVWQVLREMPIVAGSLIFLVLTVPWYVLVFQANGQTYIDSFFGYHNFERFTEAVNDHSAPWFLYFLVVLIGFFPWSIHLPVAIARLRVWQPAHWRQQPRRSQLGLFAFLWFAVIFGFFTIAATKLPSYVLPLLPAASILVGLFWSDQLARSLTRSPHPQRQVAVQISHAIAILLAVVVAGVIFYSPHWLGTDSSMPTLPQAVRQSAALPIGVGVWIAIAIADLILLLRRQGKWIWSVQLVGLVAFLSLTVMPFITTVDTLRQLPLRQLSAAIVQVQKPGEPLAMVGFKKPSVVFYTERPILFWIDHKKVIQEIRQDIMRQKPHPDSMLLIGETEKIERTRLPASQYDVLQQAEIYELVRVKLPLPPEVRPIRE